MNFLRFPSLFCLLVSIQGWAGTLMYQHFKYVDSASVELETVAEEVETKGRSRLYLGGEENHGFSLEFYPVRNQRDLYHVRLDIETRDHRITEDSFESIPFSVFKRMNKIFHIDGVIVDVRCRITAD